MATPSPDERVPIGSVLDGRYRIDAVLGTGGMGRVYRGEHTGIGRTVAIKVLHADLNRNSEAAKRFQREAIASGRLDHPNIVRVNDSGELDDGSLFLVMDALEGEPLGERLARDKRIPWEDALEILRGVLAGLHHAHEKGVVHRDIKPDNIFLARKDGTIVIKILDFGIAKLYQGSADDPASTRAGLTVGTPAYLSPEQAVGGAITPASDIYSTTILLYEMVTGRAPFEDKDPLAMLGAHVSRQPPALAEVAPDLEFPPGFEDMIHRGLAKTTAERIASATEYLTWIESVLAAAPHAIGSAPVRVPDLASLMPMLAPTPVPELGLTAMLEAIAPGELAPKPATPNPTRAVSLADLEPVPKRWWRTSAIVVGAIIVGAIVLAIALRGDKQEAVDKPAPPEAAQPEKPEAKTKPAPKKPDLKAVIGELETGKDCPARRAAIPKLVELGSPDAIPALKKARNRWVSRYLGIQKWNANACLVKDADEAIKALTR
jgi:hypothetical protein